MDRFYALYWRPTNTLFAFAAAVPDGYEIMWRTLNYSEVTGQVLGAPTLVFDALYDYLASVSHVTQDELEALAEVFPVDVLELQDKRVWNTREIGVSDLPSYPEIGPVPTWPGIGTVPLVPPTRWYPHTVFCKGS